MAKHKLGLPHSHVRFYPSVAQACGLPAAVVYGFLLYRADGYGEQDENDDSLLWVESTLSRIQRWTGLSESVVLRALKRLLEGGFLKHRRVRDHRGHRGSKYGIVKGQVPTSAECLPSPGAGEPPFPRSGGTPSPGAGEPLHRSGGTLPPERGNDPEELLKNSRRTFSSRSSTLASLDVPTSCSGEVSSGDREQESDLEVVEKISPPKTEETVVTSKTVEKPSKQVVHTSAMDVAKAFEGKQAELPDPPVTATVAQVTRWWQQAIRFHLNVEYGHIVTPKEKGNAKFLREQLGKAFVPFVVAVVRNWDLVRYRLRMNHGLKDSPPYPTFGLMVGFVNPLNQWFESFTTVKKAPVMQAVKVTSINGPPPAPVTTAPSKPEIFMLPTALRSALEWINLTDEQRVWFIAADIFCDPNNTLTDEETQELVRSELECRRKPYDQKYSSLYPTLEKLGYPLTPGEYKIST